MLKISLIYGVASVIGQILQYLTFPIFAKNLSSAEFGVVSILESLMLLFIPLLSCSVERAAQRFYFNTNFAPKKVFANALSWLNASGIIALIFAVAFETSKFSVFDTMPPLSITMMVVAAWASSVSGLALVYLQVEQKPFFYSSLYLIKGVVLFGLAYYILLFHHQNVYGFIISVTVANLVSAILSFILLPHMTISGFDFSIIKSMLRFSAPFVPSVLCAWLLAMGGRFVLQYNGNVGDVGVYTFWYKVSLGYFMCSSAINTAITPILYRILSDNSKGTGLTINLIKSLTKIYGIGGVSFILIATDVAKIMGGNAYHMSSSVFALIIIGHFCSSVMGGSSDLLLSYYKLTKIQMFIFLAGGAVSLILNLILAPYFSIVGVIIASLTGLIVIISSHWLVLRSKFLPIFPIRYVISWGATIFISGLVVDYTWQGIRILFFFVLIGIALLTLRSLKMLNAQSRTAVLRR